MRVSASRGIIPGSYGSRPSTQRGVRQLGLLLLPHQPENEAASFAERLRLGMRAVPALNFPTANLALRLSAGVACYHPPHSTQTAAELLRIADAALYAAKRQGRNRTVVHPSVAVESESHSYSAREKASAGAGQTS